MSDPYFSNVSLLLHFDGAEGSQVFTDSSSTNATVPGYGTTQIVTSQSKFGGASVYFSGDTNSGITIGSGYPNLSLDGDFTVEFWIRSTTSVAGTSSLPRVFSSPHATSAPGVFNVWQSSGSSADTNIDAIAWARSDATAPIVSTLDAINDGLWHHIAFTRQSGTARAFKDGQLKQTATGANEVYNSPSINGLLIGKRFDNLAWLTAHIDELRITKGVARYTANFTPPTEAFSNSQLLITSLSTGKTLTGYVSPALTLGFVDLPILPVNGRWAGQYRITGSTKNKSSPSNLPVGRRVRLHDQNSGEVVQETWSDDVTGAYSFDYISDGIFYITAFDHTGNYNGVIATGITPTIGAP